MTKCHKFCKNIYLPNAINVRKINHAKWMKRRQRWNIKHNFPITRRYKIPSWLKKNILKTCKLNNCATRCKTRGYKSKKTYKFSKTLSKKKIAELINQGAMSSCSANIC